jgi:hypothetical protein
MQFGNIFSSLKCSRCMDFIAMPASYRDGEWYHQRCLDQGFRQLANAKRIVHNLHTLFPSLQLPEKKHSGLCHRVAHLGE